MGQQAGVASGATSSGGRALLAVGALALLLGVFAWGWDVDPLAGKVLLALGAALVAVGWWLVRSRVTVLTSRVVLVLAVVVAIALLVEAVHLIDLSNFQRSAGGA